MQTNSLLASVVVASGLAAAASQSHHTPVECTPPAVAYTSPVHTSPVHTSPVYTSPVYTPPVHTSSKTFQQYDTPSAPIAKPAEYTTSSVHVSVAETHAPGCTTSNYPHQHTGMHTTTSSKHSTTGTSQMTRAATPTHSPVQSAANGVDAHGILIATVVAGFFFLL
ncbi:hypothetical protein NLG97_g710 [Lecanicillium saksenae]|uniref:Uncharacterized protein n=1 Tax=Lecanicillium saksenae TaxID=468837 RepID=A0ACC1R972_9HYPO|nr:hypothetical protein NLG97_g710 [Lecanicillium saksenae]